jgi:hypothetical protein
MRSHLSKIGPPPQLGHRNLIARQNSIPTRRGKRHMTQKIAKAFRLEGTARMLNRMHVEAVR